MLALSHVNVASLTGGSSMSLSMVTTSIQTVVSPGDSPMLISPLSGLNSGMVLKSLPAVGHKIPVTGYKVYHREVL